MVATRHCYRSEPIGREELWRRAGQSRVELLAVLEPLTDVSFANTAHSGLVCTDIDQREHEQDELAHGRNERILRNEQ